MSTIIDAPSLRRVLLGRQASKATGTLTAATVTLFNITGTVLITQIYGVVTTSVTVANSYKLQANPTTGTTSDLVAATDIGTTDSPAGNVLGFDGVKTSSIQTGPGSAPGLMRPIIVTAGTIEHVSAGTDGAITWYITYIPLTDDGLVAGA